MSKITVANGAPKRLLILNYEFPPLGGGGGVASYALGIGWTRLGYTVDVVTSRFRDLPSFEYINDMRIYRVPVIGRWSTNTASLVSMFSFLIVGYLKARALCRRHKYHFINTHFAVPTGPAGVAIAKFAGVRNVLSLHGGDVFDPSKRKSPHASALMRQVVRSVIKGSDVVIAQSSDTAANAHKYYRPGREIEVIPLAYEPYVQSSRPADAPMRFDRSHIYVVGVGRMVARKGFDFFVETIANLPSRYHGVLIGDGPELQPLRKLAERRGVADRLHFLGHVDQDEKFATLNGCDVYFLSSVHEGLGIVLMEAAQASLKIVSTNRGGQTDLGRYLSIRFIEHREPPRAANTIEEVVHKDCIDIHNLEELLPERIAKLYVNTLP